MTSKTKAALTLILISPVLTEMVSGNTPARAFLKPQVTLFLLLAYGFPLLMIRELSSRWRLSKAGVFSFGLAYGIVNEGLLAQTLLRWELVPIDKFDHYLYVAGFNLSWALVIVPWHALFAVYFPLVLIASWFPACAQDSWLGDRSFAFLASILAALLLFISVARTPHVQMLVCLLAILAFVFIASLFHNRRETENKRNYLRTAAFLFGMAGYPVLFLSAIVLAAKRVSGPVFFLVVPAILIVLAIVSLHASFLRSPAAEALALGAYFAMSLFLLSRGIRHHSRESLVTGAIFAVVFLPLASKPLVSLPPSEGVC